MSEQEEPEQEEPEQEEPEQEEPEQATSKGLVACPYLPLSSPLAVGPWLFTPLGEFEGPWLDARFEKLTTRLLERHVDGQGKPIDRPSLLASAASGADGSFPRETEYVALQQALSFAVLDENPKWEPNSGNLGWFTFTSDNAEIRLWEIRRDTDLVVLHSGSMVRLTTMGRGIYDEDFTVPAPLELRIPPTTASPDPEVAAAVYEVGLLAHTGGDKSVAAARVITAIKWLAKAWCNSPSIDWFDRVVFIRTGFEALLGVSRTPKLRPLVRAAFESLGASADAAFHLHWSPAEAERREHEKVGGKLTDLEHWFQYFSDTRNAIVHEGAEPDLVYDAEDSAYSGPFPQVGQQVLREAIRALLEVKFGYRDIWRDPMYRRVRDAFEDAQRELSLKEERVIRQHPTDDM